MAELEEPFLPSDSESDDSDDDHSSHSSITIEERPDPEYDDAIAYVNTVKVAFRDNVDKFVEFLNLMNDFKKRRLGIRRFLSKIKAILKDHPELLVGINTFLPEGYKISMPLDSNSDSKTPEYGDVMEFVNSVKNEFPNDIWVYKSLLEILIEDHSQQKSIEEVHQEVYTLFNDKPELLEDFKLLFPHPSKRSAEGVQKTKPRKRPIEIEEKKSSNLSYLVPSLLALLLVAFGMMISFELY